MKIKTVLISQPVPVDYEKSPYHDLSKRYGLEITFRKLIRIESLTTQEFRRQKVSIPEHTGIIFTCKNAVDNFFRLCTDLRVKIDDNTKYFCISESTAYYLQKYVQFRKRKIFHGSENVISLMNTIRKHSHEKFLLPCTENVRQEIVSHLTEAKLNWTKAIIYKTVSEDITDLDIQKFDLLVFFSPFGVESLYNNFPEYNQSGKAIAVFGQSTATKSKEKGLKIAVHAPTEKAPSMVSALDQYLAKLNKSK